MEHVDFVEMIKECQANVESITKQLNETVKSFITLASDFASNQSNKIIEDEVKTNHEHTKLLGIEKLKELKGELNDLIARFPQYVSKHLNTDRCWMHRGDFPKDSQAWYATQNNHKKIVEDEMKNLLGYAGELLIKYGYEQDSKKWVKQIHASGYQYASGIAWPKEMDTLYQDYCSMYNRLCDEKRKLDKALKDKGESEASDLWNQIQ